MTKRDDQIRRGAILMILALVISVGYGILWNRGTALGLAIIPVTYTCSLLVSLIVGVLFLWGLVLLVMAIK